jgi:hypothetical protein
LREWAPFDTDKNLGKAGVTAKLTTEGAPAPQVTETAVTRANVLKTLEYKWGGNDIRWKPEGGAEHSTGDRVLAFDMPTARIAGALSDRARGKVKRRDSRT